MKNLMFLVIGLASVLMLNGCGAVDNSCEATCTGSTDFCTNKGTCIDACANAECGVSILNESIYCGDCEGDYRCDAGVCKAGSLSCVDVECGYVGDTYCKPCGAGSECSDNICVPVDDPCADARAECGPIMSNGYSFFCGNCRGTEVCTTGNTCYNICYSNDHFLQCGSITAGYLHGWCGDCAEGEKCVNNMCESA